MVKKIQLLILGAILTSAVFIPFSMAQERPDNPEAPVERQVLIPHKQDLRADGPMVVTAHPLATDAAITTLESGGNAADAAIAAQLVLGLVEPQSSGLGGGAFLLYYDAQDGSLFTLDARETAPLQADQNLFMDKGQPLDFWQAVIGSRAVGTPGTPKLLSSMHKRFGQKNWETLFDPAIGLAENGFEISPRLAKLIVKDAPRLKTFPQTRDYFFNEDGSPKAKGTVLKNPDYAETLRLYREQGEVAFYRGALAHEIIAAVRRAPVNPGKLALKDLKEYKVKDRPNLCGPYRGYTICSMGEPSSGGLTLLQILGMLEHYDLGDEPNATAIHLIADASRLAFAERNFYMADPDFVRTPRALLLHPDYIKERGELLSAARRLTENETTPGIPPGWPSTNRSPDSVIKPPGTTHISIVDDAGNMVSMTSTIEQAFGSRLMTNGFLLNNELTDFSFRPEKNGWDVANKVEPGKRPRSSMAPTVVFRPDGSPYLIVGSAGGSRIIGYVLKTIIHVIDWDTNIDNALAAPHFLARGPKIEVETGLESFIPALESKGHFVDIGPMNSGLTAIYFHDDGSKTGAADPRREGKAASVETRRTEQELKE